MLLIYFILGGVVGLLAGLFGVGGGIVIVPFLTFVFVFYRVFDASIAIHVAIGTSLAFMVLNSSYTALSYYQKRSIRLRFLITTGISMVAGAIIGATMASHLAENKLRMLFASFLLLAAFYVLYSLYFDVRHKKQKYRKNLWLDRIVGFFVGVFSSMLGVGGSIITVPYFLSQGVPIRHSIGTASACTPVMAFISTMLYMYYGTKMVIMPASSIGFVYLPALAGLLIGGLLCSRVGVFLAHYFSQIYLKCLFVILLMITSVKMLYPV